MSALKPSVGRRHAFHLPVCMFSIPLKFSCSLGGAGRPPSHISFHSGFQSLKSHTLDFYWECDICLFLSCFIYTNIFLFNCELLFFFCCFFPYIRRRYSPQLIDRSQQTNDILTENTFSPLRLCKLASLPK